MTDLIVQMPLKIKDLRNKADQVARTIFIFQQEGLEPPSNLPLHFQSLLHFIAVLYAEDPLELELCLDFWSSDMACAGVNYRYRRFVNFIVLSWYYFLLCFFFLLFIVMNLRFLILAQDLRFLNGSINYWL